VNHHRDLILARSRSPKFKFLKLPESLQDEIIEALDANETTYLQAEQLAQAHGFNVDDNAIWSYYRAVREERHKRSVAKPFFDVAENFSDSAKVNYLTNLSMALIQILYESGYFESPSAALEVLDAVFKGAFPEEFAAARRNLSRRLKATRQG
jgi:hypothetical protein